MGGFPRPPPQAAPERQSATLCLHPYQGRPIMKVPIRKLGNSQVILIPKPILAQLGLEGRADLQARRRDRDSRDPPQRARGLGRGRAPAG